MAFAAQQIRKLKANLRPQHVKSRDADGVSLKFLEGWHILAEANRIFGFDGWNRESVSSTCVWTKQLGSRFGAAYVTRVRITVHAGERQIVREGSGVGESNAASPGQAHEFAAKAAETDATKRAFSTFGNAFGLSLYSGSGERTETKLAKCSIQSPAPPGVRSVHGESFMVGGSSALGGDGDTSGVNREAGEVPEAVTSPALSGRIDKSVLAIPELKRLRDKSHLRYVATKSCLICDRKPTHAHHSKFSQATALGRKVSDEFTVPLCATHHQSLHFHGNEVDWWGTKKIDPIAVATKLWNESRGVS